MTLQNIIKEGEREFKEEFGSIHKNSPMPSGLDTEKNILNFLSSRTTEAYRAGVEEIQNIDPVWLATCFHDYYESFAKIKGWKTQENCTNIPFSELPEENRQTMICTASAVLKDIMEKVAYSYVSQELKVIEK